METMLFSKLFRINHILLTNQFVSTLIFHAILFLSFAQILFNIFYKVTIQSEFVADPAKITASLITDNAASAITDGKTYTQN